MRTAITKRARETKAEVVGFMKTYLEDADAPDGLKFVSMAGAGELAHWEVLAMLNETAESREIGGVITFVVPLQQPHVDAVRGTPFDYLPPRTRPDLLSSEPGSSAPAVFAHRHGD